MGAPTPKYIHSSEMGPTGGQSQNLVQKEDDFGGFEGMDGGLHSVCNLKVLEHSVRKITLVYRT